MKIAGSRRIAAPLSVVNAKLLDGRSLAEAIPDLHLNSSLDGQRQRVSLTVATGPMQGQYEAAVSLSQLDTAVFELSFDGHGAKGIFNGHGHIHLEAQGSEQTLIQYEGDIEVAGLLADLSARMVQANINAIIRRCFDGLEQLLWPEKLVSEPELEPAKPLWFNTAVAAGLAGLGIFIVTRLIRKLRDSKASAA